MEQKEERNQNKTERDKSNTRHNEQMKSLSVITDVLRENSLFAKLGIVFFSSIFGGIGSLITGIGGIATAIVGLGATIIAGFKGAIGGMLNKLWPGKFPDLEDVDIDKSKNKNGDIDKSKSPNPNDIDKTKSPNDKDIDKAKSPNNDIDKKPSDIDFKDGKEKPIDVDKSKSPKKAGESVFKKIGKQGLKGIGLRALGAATGVGGAMLTAEAAYYMLDSATDGKFSESTDNLMETMSPENKPLDKIGAIQSGTLSESERAHLGKEQADKIEKERAEQKERSKEAFNVGFKNNVNSNHQNNNIYMAGFYGLTPNVHKQVPSYGVTSG